MTDQCPTCRGLAEQVDHVILLPEVKLPAATLPRLVIVTKRWQSRVLLLLALLACGDLGPDKAKIHSMGLYSCIPDETIPGGCRAGARIAKPTPDGTPFVVTARAPGAWIMREGVYYPSDLVNSPEVLWVNIKTTTDTVFDRWWINCPTCRYAYWKVEVMGPNDAVFDKDSLFWRYP